MTNNPSQVQSFPKSTYRSKRDAWIVIILWLVIIISLASAVYIPFAESSIVAIVVQEILMLGTAAYISPEDKTGFLQDLADRSPGLRFVGDRVERVAA